MKKRFEFKSMCDKCFIIMDKDEKLFGFNVEDDAGEEREFRGHEDCMMEIGRLIAKQTLEIVEGNKEK